MAKRRAGADLFINRAQVRLIMSAANILTFIQIRFGMGIFTGTALVIAAIDWVPQTFNAISATTDKLEMALTNRDDLTSLNPNNMNVLVYKQLQPNGVATIVGDMPLRSDFSSLPGGGLIVPANPLFIGVATAGYVALETVDATIYYLTKELADADFIELVQSLIPVNI